jgi:hypothetical protein
MAKLRAYRLGQLDGMGVDLKSQSEIYQATGIAVDVQYSWAEVIYMLVDKIRTLKEAEAKDDD